MKVSGWQMDADFADWIARGCPDPRAKKPRTVTCTVPGVECTADSTVIHRCPVKDEQDNGTVEIVWLTGDCTVELHSLATYLGTWRAVEATHEDLVAAIFGDVTAAGVHVTSVKYTGETGGMRFSAVLREPVNAESA